MLLAFLKVFAKLPLPVLHFVGKGIGSIIYWFPGRYRIRIDRNLRQAGYPSKGMGRRASAQTGAMIMETPKVWLNHQSCLRITSSQDDAKIGRASCREREKKSEMDKSRGGRNKEETQ